MKHSRRKAISFYAETTPAQLAAQLARTTQQLAKTNIALGPIGPDEEFDDAMVQSNSMYYSGRGGGGGGARWYEVKDPRGGCRPLEGLALLRYLGRNPDKAPPWEGGTSGLARVWNPETGYFDPIAPVVPRQPTPPPAQPAPREADNFWTQVKVFLGIHKT